MLFELMKNLKSYYILEISTPFPEKALNMIQRAGFVIWEITFESGRLRLKCLSEDMSGIEKLLFNLGATWEKTDIRGAQRVYEAILRYKGFIIAGMICFVLVIGFSRFIWSLEVFGERGIPQQSIIKCLYDAGIREGCLKSSLDKEHISILLMKNFPSLSEAQVDIKGSALKITLFERDSPVVVYDTSVAVDLVASRDAVVSFVDTYNGVALVSPGDSVKKGDVLISGELRFGAGDMAVVRNVHAMGKILSSQSAVFEEISLDGYIPDQYAEYKSIKSYYLFGKVFTVSEEELPYNPVKEYIYGQRVRIFMFSIPVLFDEIRCYNINDCAPKSEYEISREIYSKVSERLGDKCTITDIVYNVKAGDERKLLAEVTVNYSESIAEQRQIGE